MSFLARSTLVIFLQITFLARSTLVIYLQITMEKLLRK